MNTPHNTLTSTSSSDIYKHCRPHFPLSTLGNFAITNQLEPQLIHSFILCVFEMAKYHEF